VVVRVEVRVEEVVRVAELAAGSLEADRAVAVKRADRPEEAKAVTKARGGSEISRVAVSLVTSAREILEILARIPDPSSSSSSSKP
jgi:hypothetical protein